MDRFSVFVPKVLPKEEYFIPNAPDSCKGCGEALAVRQVYKAIGREILRGRQMCHLLGGVVRDVGGFMMNSWGTYNFLMMRHRG